MFDEVLNKCAENNNYTIYTSMCKAQRILMRSYDPVCSISGGSDSDIVLDLIHKVDEDGRVKYFWIDTGLEYSATKEHLDYLEQKYGITIERVKPELCEAVWHSFPVKIRFRTDDAIAGSQISVGRRIT